MTTQLWTKTDDNTSSLLFAPSTHHLSHSIAYVNNTMLFFQSAVQKAFAPSRRFFHASAARLEKLNVEGLAKRVALKGQNVLVRVDLNVPLAKVGCCKA
jgi:Skp family chaperone for outer membrane proteins